MQPDSVREGEHVTLKCGTSCQLDATVWFKDGKPVAKAEFQAQAKEAGNYSRAVEGQESVQSDPVAPHVQCKYIHGSHISSNTLLFVYCALKITLKLVSLNEINNVWVTVVQFVCSSTQWI